MKCRFCGYRDGAVDADLISQHYDCVRCGSVRLTQECHGDFEGEGFTTQDKKIISTCLRTEYERRGRKPLDKELTLGELRKMIEQYRPLDPLEKMDNALLNLEKATRYVGERITIKINEDFFYYHCSFRPELNSILAFLCKEGFIDGDDPENPHSGLWITPKGYEKLRELKTRLKDSRQCFVAMWLDPDMNGVYEESIMPAIEYIEQGEAEPRFKALRIDNKEYTNDINDEIISEIRRSRFMVCDLTGYRGGVYFEAGFAYGLGLEVIYTCQKDWITKQVNKILDSEGKEHEIVQEGIHFDLEHRNRIEWTDSNLPKFKDQLTNRIKAVIV